MLQHVCGPGVEIDYGVGIVDQVPQSPGRAFLQRSVVAGPERFMFELPASRAGGVTYERCSNARGFAMGTTRTVPAISVDVR